MNSISFEKWTLSNGLDVIVHEDHALPIVSVNVWYHVGSKDEEPGKTGFAHLFEHMMFEGSKHHNKSHFDALQKVGATLNGSTNGDRTNYWENLPSNHLELALWLESDRMGFLLDAIDQGRFDIQRDVVKNERRQSYENRPYGASSLRLLEAVYPAPHPYHWPTIGYHEDLDAATLDDVSAFFRLYYGPSNASLAITGDLDTSEARDLVDRYFAGLEPAPTVPRVVHADSPLAGFTSLTLHDRVTLPRVTMAWPTVPRFHKDEPALSILAAILGDGKSSRLHRSLVYENRTAQSVTAFHGSAEVAGDLQVHVTAAAGIEADRAETDARIELQKIIAAPPTEREIEAAKNGIEWQDARMLSTIGGFAGRANRLNSFNVMRGDPSLINTDTERYLSVTADDVHRVASEYLGSRQVRMLVLPEPSRSAHQGVELDRSMQPSATYRGPFVPAIPERSRLSNGLEVRVIEKRGAPVVAFGLALRTGAANDPLDQPGLATFMTGMLEEGTTSRSSQEIAEEFEFLGSHWGANPGRERTVLTTQSLTKHWPRALELITDIAMNPTFPEEELSRVRQERLTSLRRMRDDPTALAGRVGPALLYGLQSRYGHPMSGSEVAVEGFDRDALVDHFRRGFGPDGATLIVAGDVSIVDVVTRAEALLGSWHVDGPNDGTGYQQNEEPRNKSGTTIYLLDKPGAAQSIIRTGHIGPQRKNDDYFPLTLFNQVFGGQFTARLNMNLREDKGYSYGYRSWFEWHTDSSLFLSGGGVQTAVTRESVEETLKEFDQIRNVRPVETKEFEDAKSSMLQEFPSNFETAGQLQEQMGMIVAFDLPDDYYGAYERNIEAISLDDVRRVANERIQSEELTLLIVGDREIIEPGLADLGLPIRYVDHDATVVRR
ncbi:MAG: pitrilysin family protein [Dehalococcoidia bacterium]|nr:pitrilysin family protein [Dehalococcoidia bacterium]